MNTLFAKAQAAIALEPMIVAKVKAVENDIQLPDAGAAKLSIVTDTMQAIYDLDKELQNSIPWADVVSLTKTIAIATVAAYKKLGLFRSGGQAPAAPPVPTVTTGAL